MPATSQSGDAAAPPAHSTGKKALPAAPATTLAPRSTADKSLHATGRAASTDDDAAAPALTTAYAHTADEQSLFSGVLVFLQLFAWVSAFAIAPYTVFAACCHRAHLPASLALCVLAYVIAPLLQYEPIAWMKAPFQRFYCRWYRSCSINYEDFDATTTGKRKLMLVHPHGIFCSGWSAMFAAPELHSFTFCTAPALFHFGFLFRLLVMLSGRIAPADPKTFQSMMRKRENLALLPGGFHDATILKSGTERIYTGNKGNMKYALQHGYALVPTYVFGENDMYHNAQGFFKLRLWLNSLQIPTVFPFGWLFCPLLPRRDVDLHIVVGQPVQLPLIKEPTRADVAKYHAAYIKALCALFDRHKAAFGAADRELELWPDADSVGVSKRKQK
jgi:2-acylglycerol O-acyltransferase 2